MNKRVQKVLGLVMVMLIILTSLPIQGVAFATDANSLKSNTENAFERVDRSNNLLKDRPVALLPPPEQQDIVIGDGTGDTVEINVPSRASMVMSFPNNEIGDVTVPSGLKFDLTAPTGTLVKLTYTDDDDNGQVFENVKVEYVGVNGKHVLSGPLTLTVGVQNDPNDANTIIDYVTSWKGEGENENPPSPSYNLWVAADDNFTAYLNGSEVKRGSDYAVLYKENVSVVGNDLIAARASDTDGTANIAGFKLVLKNDDASYTGTNTSWQYYIGTPPTYNDGNQTIQWYEAGYKGDGWLDANQVTQPENTWPIDWPTNNYIWIWAPNYDVVIHGSIDTPVYFRNGNVEGIAPSVSINPDSKTFGTPFDVTITSDDNLATIYYKLDNGSYSVYNGPFEVDSTVTVTAYAKDIYDNESDKTSETYTLDTEAHVDIQPESKTFKTSLSVSIVSSDGSTIYYNINSNSDPDASSTLYQGSITINSDTVVKAFAVDTYGNEATDMESYVVDNEATVEISPESQTFTGSLSVSISTTDSSTIYYTTDGSAPQAIPADLYNGAFTITEDKTVKALGVDAVGNTATDTESYIADNEAFVDVKPESKTFNTSQVVEIESTDGSTIYYTTDGTVPSALNGTLYNGTFTIFSTLVVKAFAVDSFGNTATDFESYILDNEADVDITPPSQTFKGDLEVTISTSDNSVIYYTTDGSTPQAIPEDLYSGPFTIDEDTVVNALAVDAAGNTAVDSETYDADNAAHVDVKPDSKTYKDSQVIEIVSTDGSTIYYTTDGTTPSISNGTLYTGTFTITTALTVKAFAFDSVGNEATDEETYEVDNSTFVTITPESTTFNGTINVSIASETDAVIYVTTNGDTPTTSSPVYSGSFTVSSTTTVKALAVDLLGNEANDVEVYTFDDSMPPISIDPASQTFNDKVTVTLTSENSNTIYYTLDGTTPDGTSTLYTGPFDVESTTVVKAIAYNGLNTASQVVTETYTFEPTVIIPEPGNAAQEASNIILRYGYNRTPEEGYKDLEAVITPGDLDVIGTPVFTILNGGSIIDLSNERVSYEAAGVAEVLVTISYNDGETVKTITDKVQVTVVFYQTPSDPPSDPPSNPPTSSPSVSIRLDKDPVELEYGSDAFEDLLEYDLTETIRNSNNSNVTWTIGDDTVATVDQNGVVTAVRQGETTVTVRHNASGETATSDVIVFLVGDEPNPLGLVTFNDPYVFGYPDTTFRPKNSVTRAEVATMFAKILKLQIERPGGQIFDDVKPDKWYYNYVQAIRKTDIFVGDASGNFRPDEPMTRAEIATVFAKYWQYLDTPVNRNAVEIVDVDGTHWASAYIYMMYNSGIVTGFTDGTYKPNDPTLREQVVGMINALIARPPFEAEASKFIDIDNTHWAYGNIEAASQLYVGSNPIFEE